MYKPMILFLSVAMAALNYSQDKREIRQIDVERLIQSLNFENEGVRESAIHYASKYMILETTGALVKILLHDKNEKLRLFAANALYKFGGNDIIDHLAYAKRFDKSKIVRNTCSELIKNYYLNSYEKRLNRTRKNPETIYGITITPPTKPVIRKMQIKN